MTGQSNICAHSIRASAPGAQSKSARVQSIEKCPTFKRRREELRDGPRVPAHDPHHATLIQRCLPLRVTRFETPYWLDFLARKFQTGDVVPEMLQRPARPEKVIVLCMLAMYVEDQ